MRMRSIEIDFDIHKLIEGERRNFDEPPNAALRRLLHLPEKREEAELTSEGTNTMVQGSGRPWQGDGVILPSGTKTRMIYGRPKRTYSGVIVNGEWVVEGKKFDSPSGAASGVAITGRGKNTRLNGWSLWDIQRPGESEWTPISILRERAAESNKVAAQKFLAELGL